MEWFQRVISSFPNEQSLVSFKRMSRFNLKTRVHSQIARVSSQTIFHFIADERRNKSSNVIFRVPGHVLNMTPSQRIRQNTVLCSMVARHFHVPGSLGCLKETEWSARICVFLKNGQPPKLVSFWLPLKHHPKTVR